MRSCEKLRNENMRLSAAHSEVAGAVSKISSAPMYTKEAAVLALKLERWHEDDRAELYFRALYRSWDTDGQRLGWRVADLKGGMFDKMKREIIDARDKEIAEHLRPAVWTVQLEYGFSWHRDRDPLRDVRSQRRRERGQLASA